MGPLPDQVAFVLREGAEDGEDGATGWTGGVNLGPMAARSGLLGPGPARPRPRR